MELINILIRTSNRPILFKRCLNSVLDQGYSNIRIIISTDNDVDYIPENLEVIRVKADRSLPYFYDCYLNELKSLVTSGYFLCLDDDDVLIPGVLNKIPLDAPAIMVQLDHLGKIVPKDERILPGQIGMPCIILHHSLKDIAHLSGGDHGDYHWIKEISEKVELKFVPLVVVRSDQKGYGN